MTEGLAVVTGGSRGIGRAVVGALASAGWRVLAVGRDGAALADVAAAGRREGRDVSTAVCDVTDEEAVGALLAGLDVEVLVNNAGMSGAAPLHRTSMADWNAHLAVNATGAFLCTRAVLPAMRRRGAGRIVMVASIAGVVGAPYIAAYTASKHALVGLMRVAAAEVAGSGITANAVCPGYVASEMTDRSVERIVETTGRSHDEALAALTGASPLGRLLEPAEVAAAVAFLCSDAAGAINGQTLVIDGGGISP